MPDTKKIRKKMIDKEVTVRSIRKSLGTSSDSCISETISGKKKSRRIAMKIAEILDVEIEEIFPEYKRAV